jgi:hypothetical protein
VLAETKWKRVAWLNYVQLASADNAVPCERCLVQKSVDPPVSEPIELSSCVDGVKTYRTRSRMEFLCLVSMACWESSAKESS